MPIMVSPERPQNGQPPFTHTSFFSRRAHKILLWEAPSSPKRANNQRERERDRKQHHSMQYNNEMNCVQTNDTRDVLGQGHVSPRVAWSPLVGMLSCCGEAHREQHNHSLAPQTSPTCACSYYVFIRISLALVCLRPHQQTHASTK